jgi:hypothetical protein
VGYSQVVLGGRKVELVENVELTSCKCVQISVCLKIYGRSITFSDKHFGLLLI